MYFLNDEVCPNKNKISFLKLKTKHPEDTIKDDYDYIVSVMVVKTFSPDNIKTYVQEKCSISYQESFLFLKSLIEQEEDDDLMFE